MRTKTKKSAGNHTTGELPELPDSLSRVRAAVYGTALTLSVVRDGIQLKASVVDEDWGKLRNPQTGQALVSIQQEDRFNGLRRRLSDLVDACMTLAQELSEIGR